MAEFFEVFDTETKTTLFASTNSDEVMTKVRKLNKVIEDARNT